MASPTVHLKSVFITSVIGVKEEHDVAVVNLPGTFLSANNPDLIHMMLNGEMEELMAMIQPCTYQKFISCDERGNAIL